MSTSLPASAGPAWPSGWASLPGMIVMEIGYDDDVDEALRAAVEERTGEGWSTRTPTRSSTWCCSGTATDDGDLVDVLVDAIAPLADNGVIWLLTPKRGRAGYVEPSDIAEAAAIAGLSQTSMRHRGSGVDRRPAGRSPRPAARR